MRRERHTIVLCWLLLHRQLSTQPTRGARSAQIRLASPSSESRLSRSEAGTQLTAFSQIPKSSALAFCAWRHSHTLVQISIWDFYFDISEWHILSARAWTPALMFHLTNPCTKRKVLILTKPKGKIYKTKSFCNYITFLLYYYFAYSIASDGIQIDLGWIPSDELNKWDRSIMEMDTISKFLVFQRKYIFCSAGYFVLNSRALTILSLDIHYHYLLGIYIYIYIYMFD